MQFIQNEKIEQEEDYVQLKQLVDQSFDIVQKKEQLKIEKIVEAYNQIQKNTLKIQYHLENLNKKYKDECQNDKKFMKSLNFRIQQNINEIQMQLIQLLEYKPILEENRKESFMDYLEIINEKENEIIEYPNDINIYIELIEQQKNICNQIVSYFDQFQKDTSQESHNKIYFYLNKDYPIKYYNLEKAQYFPTQFISILDSISNIFENFLVQETQNQDFNNFISSVKIQQKKHHLHQKIIEFNYLIKKYINLQRDFQKNKTYHFNIEVLFKSAVLIIDKLVQNKNEDQLDKKHIRVLQILIKTLIQVFTVSLLIYE